VDSLDGNGVYVRAPSGRDRAPRGIPAAGAVYPAEVVVMLRRYIRGTRGRRYSDVERCNLCKLMIRVHDVRKK